jgi:hypothetical protein
MDRSPINAKVAMRLAKFFKGEPKYWVDLQTAYDMTRANADKEFLKELSAIVDVGKYEFVRKPHTPKEPKTAPMPAKKSAKEKDAPVVGNRKGAAAKVAAPAPAPASKRGRKPKAK